MTRILTEEFPKGELMERRELHIEKVLVIFIRIPLLSLEHGMRKLRKLRRKPHWKRIGRATLRAHRGPKVEFFPLARL